MYIDIDISVVVSLFKRKRIREEKREKKKERKQTRKRKS